MSLTNAPHHPAPVARFPLPRLRGPVPGARFPFPDQD